MTKQEIIAKMQSVKPPTLCAAGDPDLAVWWECRAMLTEIEHRERTDIKDPGFDIIEAIPVLMEVYN